MRDGGRPCAEYNHDFATMLPSVLFLLLLLALFLLPWLTYYGHGGADQLPDFTTATDLRDVPRPEWLPFLDRTGHLRPRVEVGTFSELYYQSESGELVRLPPGALPMGVVHLPLRGVWYFVEPQRQVLRIEHLGLVRHPALEFVQRLTPHFSSTQLSPIS